MNLLVLSINYAPEPTGFAQHVKNLCEYLAGRQHDVTVLTGFPFAPYWKRYDGYTGKFVTFETVNGVKLVRLTHFIPRKPNSTLQRILMEGTFCQLAGPTLVRLARSRWDVVYYVGAQPSLAMLARWIACFFGIPYVVNVQDLAAQSAAGVAIVKTPFLLKILLCFEYSAYKKASGAIVLCDAFRDALVAHGYPAGRIRTIRSPVNLNLIRPVLPDPSFRQKLGLSEDDFVLLFSGSMGLKQGLTNVIEASRLLQDNAPSVKWVLVGDGESKATIKDLVAKYNMDKTVHFLPLQPEEQMSKMFATANVLLLNQVSEVKDTVIPSKLLTYMAAGKPVLASVNTSSQGAAILRESIGGIIVPPQDPAALADAVKYLTKDENLKIMGQRNREYAEKHFDQQRILALQEDFLLEAAHAQLEEIDK